MTKPAKVENLFTNHAFADEKQSAQEAVRFLLRHIGEDPRRPGLVDTPRRVIEAYSEIFAGYQEEPLEYLQRTFEESEGYQEPVIVSDISFQSICEHHMLPFTGVVHVAYVPQKRVVGLSKLCRVVQAYARRLQMQERLTQQIADCLSTGLATTGVGVIIEAYHSCMVMRGVRSEQARTTTMVLRGAFQENKNLEERFFRVASGGQRGRN